MLALALAAALFAATPVAAMPAGPMAAAAVTSAPHPDPKAERAREARNLKVFDAAWSGLQKHYFDRSMGGQDWTAVRAELRPKAAAAKDELDLYVNVLTAMTRRLPSSHVGVSPPEGRPMRVARLEPAPECREGFTKVNLGLRPGRGWAPKAPMIVAVVDKGSPAEQAGIEPGEALTGWSVSAVNCKSFRVQLELGGAESKRTVAYDTPPAPPRPDFATETLASGVKLIRFEEFTPELAGKAVAELRTAQAAGVIIDLRENPGGLIAAAQTFAAALLDEGTTLGTHHRVRGDFPMVADAPKLRRGETPARYEGPVAVLIGPRSSSASEIIAEALRHHGRAVIVGERTSGSVMVGRRYALPDGGSLQVAVADFTAPSGKRLEDAGVEPDVFARQTLAAIRADRDLVVEAAERALRERPAQQVTAGATPPSS